MSTIAALARLPVLGLSVATTALADAVLALLACALVLPLALALGAGLVLLDLAARARAALARRAPPRAPGRTAPPSAASIVIPSWNGASHLRRLLPSLFEAIRRHGGDHEVIVVDNGSEDDTAAYLRASFPSVRVVALSRNRFFGGGIRAGVAAATRDVLVLLNNDMVVDPGFLRPLLHGFDHPDVFAVTSQIHFQDPARRREETGKTRAAWHRGRLELRHVEPGAADRRLGYTPAFWAGGGSSAFDRARFVELGGFDRLYDPFYWEDTDLSYRAWKRGWQVRFAPASVVYHEHRGTVRRLPPAFVERVLRRNEHLFVWSNVTDAAATAAHGAGLAFRLLERARRADGPFRRALGAELLALLGAVRRLPAVLRRRRASHRQAVRSDREVFALANSTHRATAALRDGRAAPRPRPLRLLVLSTRLPRLDTDGSWILFDRLRELARRHEITLFSFLDHQDEAEQAEPLRRFCARVITHVRTRVDRPGNAHHLVPHRLATDYGAAPMRRAVRDVLESEDFDVVQVEYAEMAHLVRDQLAGLPSVYTVHEPLSVSHRRLLEQARGPGRLRRAFEWAQALDHELGVVRAFGRVVTLSSADEHALRAYLPDLPVSTIPSAVDGRLLRPLPPVAEQPCVLFVGYFKHAPNVDAALWLAREIFPAVRRRVPAARLRIVGRDPTAEVRALARLPGVEVAGFVPDLRSCLAAAAAVAIPIRLGAGLRGKLLEAWAAARAVVITSRGAEGFAVEHGRNALVADDAPGFAAGLAACLGDPELRRRLGARGRAHVLERHTVAAAAARYEELYLDLLGRRSWRRVPSAALPAWDLVRKEAIHAHPG